MVSVNHTRNSYTQISFLMHRDIFKDVDPLGTFHIQGLTFWVITTRLGFSFAKCIAILLCKNVILCDYV